MWKQSAFLKHIADPAPVRRHIDRCCLIEQDRVA
jgi:hypothetical protein